MIAKSCVSSSFLRKVNDHNHPILKEREKRKGKKKKRRKKNRKEKEEWEKEREGPVQGTTSTVILTGRIAWRCAQC